MNLPTEAVKLKRFREELGLTQIELGELLDIKTTADIERGKTRITGQIVMELYKQHGLNPLWLYGESKKQHVSKGHVLPHMISVNEEGQENILMVNKKAAAGYGENIGDTEYYNSLPAFTFPLFEYKNATFRGFQISGDSMTPYVREGDWVIAKAIQSLQDVSSSKMYVIVEVESIRLKKIRKTKNASNIELVSTNPEYPPVTIKTEGILEIWEYHSKISLGNPLKPGISLESIYDELQDIKKAVS